MNRATVIRELISRTKKDSVSYFRNAPVAKQADQVVEWVLSGDSRLASIRNEVEAMIPDTDEDGSWECSYALNTGVMILSLIDYEATEADDHYIEAVTKFFDTVDFKVQQELESQGIAHPNKSQIANHPVFLREHEWFNQLNIRCQKHQKNA